MNPLKIYRELEEIEGWLEFEPETIREFEILDKNVSENEELFNIIMALQTAINVQSDDEGFYFNDWRVFEKIVLSLLGVVPNFLEIEHAEPYEIHTVLNIFKEINDNVDFNDEVASYIAASYNRENIIYCPFYKKVDNKLENVKLRNKIIEIWEQIPEDPEPVIEEINELEDSIVAQQIKKLLYIKVYSDLYLESERSEE